MSDYGNVGFARGAPPTFDRPSLPVRCLFPSDSTWELESDGWLLNSPCFRWCLSALFVQRVCVLLSPATFELEEKTVLRKHLGVICMVVFRLDSSACYLEVT